MSHVLVVSGSQQRPSQSRRVSEYMAAQLSAQGCSSGVLDLAEIDLPLWTGESASDRELIKSVGDRLEQATSFVFVVPEWNGMAPPALKNLLTWFGSKKFAHKPALLCAISAGQGGAFVIAELRGSSYKNSRICYLPEHLIIRDVTSVLDGEAAAGNSDDYYHGRIGFALKNLLAYDQALGAIRPELLEPMKEFANGMS